MKDTAIVTGAGAGIGRAVAWQLAQSGVGVAAVDIDANRLGRLAQEASTAGLDLRPFVMDTTDEEAVQNVVATVNETGGGPTFLFNNVGIQTYGTVADTPTEVWRKTLAVNVDSQYFFAKYSVPAMRRRGGGAIVNTASVQGLQSQANVAAYATSKAAILGLTRSMAVDCAPYGIRVNAICPGSIDTPLLREAAQLMAPDDPEGAIHAWGQHHVLGRVGTPEEVAHTVLFLLREATFITGATIVVDGGLTVKLM